MGVRYDDMVRVIDTGNICNWTMLKLLIDNMPEEEFNKIPNAKDFKEIKLMAEKYGICDTVFKSDNEYVEIFCIGQYLLRGGTKKF